MPQLNIQFVASVAAELLRAMVVNERVDIKDPELAQLAVQHAVNLEGALELLRGSTPESSKEGCACEH